MAPALVWMGCVVAPAKEALGTPGDMACVSTQKSRLRHTHTPQGTARGGGFGACSRVWVLEVGGVAQPGLPLVLLEKQKGEIMGVFFQFLG